MSTYIIDAYNLIHKIAKIKDSNTPQKDLINFIRKNRLTGNINNRVIIVFDGHPTNESFHAGSYEIVYSFNQSADDIIKEKISIIKDKNQTIVVSNDNEIKNRARVEGANSKSTSDFLKNMKSNNDTNDHKLSKAAEKAITTEMEKIFLGKKKK